MPITRLRRLVFRNAMLIRTICTMLCLALGLLKALPISANQPAVTPHPVWFEENAGQAPADVAFVGQGFGVPLVIFKDGALGLGSETPLVRLEPERSSAISTVYGLSLIHI